MPADADKLVVFMNRKEARFKQIPKINQREIRQYFTSQRCFLGIKSHISDTSRLIPLALQIQHSYDSVSWTLLLLGQSTAEMSDIPYTLSVCHSTSNPWMDLKYDTVYTVVMLTQIKGCCLTIQIPGENKHKSQIMIQYLSTFAWGWLQLTVPRQCAIFQTKATCYVDFLGNKYLHSHLLNRHNWQENSLQLQL